jgi:hypothetical protein
MVEIRVPHPNSAMALCYDHKHTICDEQVDHWTRSALEFWYGDGRKRLDLVARERAKGGDFAWWRQLMDRIPGSRISDDDIMGKCSNACHESRYTFRVVSR